MRAVLRRREAAPLLLGLLLTLAGCGGGGGGSAVADGAPAPNPTVASAASGTPGLASGLGPGGVSSGVTTTTPSTTSPEPASGSSSSQPQSTPAAEVRYALGPSSIANDTTADYQNLVGMSATADGGYRIVWMTATFDAEGVLQRAWFEQRFDAAGQRVGGETSIAEPTEDLSGSRAGRMEALGGGYLQFAFTDALRPGLLIQHFAPDGAALDAPIQLGGASHSWSAAGLALPNGAVAITWQYLSSVGPGELQTALMTPGPR